MLSGCHTTSPTTKPRRGGPSPTRHAYGNDPAQFGDLYLPEGKRRTGTVVVIHGGFWQAGYGLDLGAAIAADLAGRGWGAWNVEYRRLSGGGGWPTTFEDIAAGVDHFTELGRHGLHQGPVVLIGHSAGGQLAAWAANRGDLPAGSPGGVPQIQPVGVVAQAGVLDLATAARRGLGGSSVPDLLGGTPETVPERYAAADPVEQVPLAIPVRCVHGRSDSTVPISQSRGYVDAATAAGADASLVEVPGDHFSLIDAGSAAWKTTVALLPSLFEQS